MDVYDLHASPCEAAGTLQEAGVSLVASQFSSPTPKGPSLKGPQPTCDGSSHAVPHSQGGGYEAHSTCAPSEGDSQVGAESPFLLQLGRSLGCASREQVAV